MTVDTCELCGNQSNRFTCQMCITTGNFWADKARFSFNGKKQIVYNLKGEKSDLQDQVAKAYTSSCESKESTLKSVRNEIVTLQERIELIKQQTNDLRDQTIIKQKLLVERHKRVNEKKLSLQKFVEKLETTQTQHSKTLEFVADVRDELQRQSQDVLRSLNRNIYKINNSDEDNKSMLNIPFHECCDASSYVRQIKINRNEELSHNTYVVLSLLTQLCNVLSPILDCNLPYKIDLSSFAGYGKTSRLIFTSVKHLSSNILYLCLSQQVHPELLEPYAFISNLQQLFESEDVCDYRTFCHSLDRPGDSDSEDTPPSSSDSDAGWETVTEAQEEPAPMGRSSSYLGSLIWK